MYNPHGTLRAHGDLSSRDTWFRASPVFYEWWTLGLAATASPLVTLFPNRDALCPQTMSQNEVPVSSLTVSLRCFVKQQGRYYIYDVNLFSPNQHSSLTHYELMEMSCDSELWSRLTQPGWLPNSSLSGLYLGRDPKHHIARFEAILNCSFGGFSHNSESHSAFL